MYSTDFSKYIILDNLLTQMNRTCSLKMHRAFLFLLKLTFSLFFNCHQVVEHAYNLGTAAQKQELLGELYSTELRLFKGLTSTTEKR